MKQMNPAIQPTTSILGTLLTGLTGVTSSGITYLATMSEDIEMGIRMTAGALGIVVALLTIWKLAKDLKKK